MQRCYCGRQATSACGKCREMYYCSKECQVTHWPRHKLLCGLPEELHETYIRIWPSIHAVITTSGIGAVTVLYTETFSEAVASGPHCAHICCEPGAAHVTIVFDDRTVKTSLPSIKCAAATKKTDTTSELYML